MADGLDLGWSLGTLFRSWQTTVTGIVGELPHGPRGFQLLGALDGDRRAPTQAELSAHLAIDRTVLTYVIDDLVAAGLVERRTEERDRRVRRIALTPNGRRRLKSLRAKVDAAESALFPGLSPVEAVTLRALLERAAAGAHLGTGEHDACRVVADILADEGAGASHAAGVAFGA
jgi:DNA-binding MarR family transcriptional regulator